MIERPVLCLVAGPADCAGRPLPQVLEAALRGGVTLFQLRMKDATDAEAEATARRILPLLRDAQVPLVINDRIAVAAAVGAAGVHLGPDDAAPRVARAALGPGALIGRSVKADDPVVPEIDAVDYLGAGVFATPTKRGTSPFGLAGLARLCRGTARPVLGIGGIDRSNAGAVMAAGAAGIAVVSAIAAADDPRAAAAALKDAIA